MSTYQTDLVELMYAIQTNWKFFQQNRKNHIFIHKKNYLNCSQHQNKSIVCKCLKWKKLFIETVETKKKSEIKKFEKLFPYFIMFQLQQYREKISHQLVI